jgi:hypothetical protein
LTALRAREAAQGLQGNTIQGRGDARPGHAPVTDNITKKGTIIFRAGLSAVRDDGDKLQVSREATREGCKKLYGWRWNATAAASPSTARRNSRRRSSARPLIPSYPSRSPIRPWRAGGLRY